MRCNAGRAKKGLPKLACKEDAVRFAVHANERKSTRQGERTARTSGIVRLGLALSAFRTTETMYSTGIAGVASYADVICCISGHIIKQRWCRIQGMQR
jgi:hypothetical protein